MSFDVLYSNSKEGVAPGGLRDKEQIKVLICYIMHETDVPVTSDFMCGILQKCGSANYFEASNSFAELVANGQLVKCNEELNLYTLDESGKFVVKNLADELPSALKDNTLKKYKHYLHQYDIKQQNNVQLKTKNNRTYIECTVNDGDNPLLTVDMYMPNAEQASLVRNVFYNNTDVIYQAVVALMTGDKKTALNVISVADINTEDFI
ncbi:MAG: DUF4364 family protein [Acutalibacteraceae bacterium]|nr:DUF4364 family protein [Acutalibacteraceae bacterium]